jgi:hypothetical protein
MTHVVSAWRQRTLLAKQKRVLLITVKSDYLAKLKTKVFEALHSRR